MSFVFGAGHLRKKNGNYAAGHGFYGGKKTTSSEVAFHFFSKKSGEAFAAPPLYRYFKKFPMLTYQQYGTSLLE